MGEDSRRRVEDLRKEVLFLLGLLETRWDRMGTRRELVDAAEVLRALCGKMDLQSELWGWWDSEELRRRKKSRERKTRTTRRPARASRRG